MSHLSTDNPDITVSTYEEFLKYTDITDIIITDEKKLIGYFRTSDGRWEKMRGLTAIQKRNNQCEEEDDWYSDSEEIGNNQNCNLSRLVAFQPTHYYYEIETPVEYKGTVVCICEPYGERYIFENALTIHPGLQLFEYEKLSIEEQKRHHAVTIPRNMYSMKNLYVKFNTQQIVDDIIKRCVVENPPKIHEMKYNEFQVCYRRKNLIWDAKTKEFSTITNDNLEIVPYEKKSFSFYDLNRSSEDNTIYMNRLLQDLIKDVSIDEFKQFSRAVFVEKPQKGLVINTKHFQIFKLLFIGYSIQHELYFENDSSSDKVSNRKAEKRKDKRFKEKLFNKNQTRVVFIHEDTDQLKSKIHGYTCRGVNVVVINKNPEIVDRNLTKIFCESCLDYDKRTHNFTSFLYWV